MTENFLEQIESYLAKHREELERYRESMKHVCMSYHRPSPSELDRRLRRIRETFPQYLLNFIAEHGMSEVEVYQRAHLDRRTFSKLRNIKDYMPSKNTVLLIALAMELSLDEAEELLHEGGYHLSEHSKKDTIIKFFFEQKIYDLFLLDEALDHYGFKPLGS